MEPAIYRLLICGSASLALHVVTLGGSSPISASSVGKGSANPTVLQAALLPHKLIESARSGREVRQGVALFDATQPQMEIQTGVGQGKQDFEHTDFGNDDFQSVALPSHEKWYTAEELDVRADPLNAVNIVYPDSLAGNRTRGHVLLALLIDEHGRVRKAEVIASAPDRRFDEAAIQAWRDVRFSPALKGNRPVKSEKLLEIGFAPE